jgi:peptidoglycan LD-endopeptidase LytH
VVAGHVRRSRRGRALAWAALGVVAIAAVVAVGSLAERRGSPAAARPGSVPGWSASPAPTSPTSSTPSSASPFPTRAIQPRYVFPVVGQASYQRVHADYPASDIIAPCGAVVRAVTDGIVLEVSRTDRYDEATDDGAARGGLFVSLRGDDGVRYYGSHLRTVNAGIEPGTRVRRAQPVGRVGDTGHAGVCHLHFGISPLCAGVGDWWIRRGVVWPWSYLDSWRAGGHASPVPAATAWRGAHGCPRTPPPGA